MQCVYLLMLGNSSHNIHFQNKKAQYCIKSTFSCEKVLFLSSELLMASLFQKFREAVKTLAKRPAFSKDPRQLQFEVDINRLYLYSSYNRLGKSADEADAEEIIEMASKASVTDQQMHVQENVHSQIKTFCAFMDEILLPNENDPLVSQQASILPRRSGLSFAVGRNGPTPNNPAVPQTRPLTQAEVSQKLKDQLGYTLNVKPSQISHKDAGQGLFLDGVVDAGAVLAFYPGVVYSPAYYRYIPGYPKVDAQNPYLITRYDGNVINAQPWGFGGYERELWNGRKTGEIKRDMKGTERGSEKIWKLLSKPLEGNQGDNSEVIERRNPLALAHFANHPPKGVQPNVMICPYDFPLTENNMRVYIPNISFGNAEVNVRRLGTFWFKSGVSKDSGSHVPTLKSLVLIATRTLQDEELLLNYRLSNTKRRPEWYAPVDEEEDRRRWS
ncbi:uncharacterized protein LOC133301592 [Gastrolobium bilobum]|uniref:uncharacterized protein LOC133301592 n=1 Tax=Gastrolobium bilobum TaxID=150636 RepID=UPI002AB04C69|nr:uncharacterized protein LOC133301592 [Gastrolobium bilobum]